MRRATSLVQLKDKVNKKTLNQLNREKVSLF